jgi:hypothetical protein
MALIDVNWNPPPRQLRQFAGLFLVVFGGLATLSYFDDKPLLLSQVLWGLSVVVGITGLIFPPLVRPVYVVMMAVALPIGFVVSSVLLVIIYYLILTPIGLVMRFFGYDPMRRRRPSGVTSFWTARPRTGDVRRYFRQY